MRMDVFVVGDGDGYVVAPVGARLPEDEMNVLGPLRYGWPLESQAAVPRLDWRTVLADIDARGYSIVPNSEVNGLLALPQASLRADYPEYHLRYAA